MPRNAALQSFPWMVPASRVFGGILLVALGLFLALRPTPVKKPQDALPEPKRRFGGKILLGLLATGVNPTLLATWGAVVTSLHAATPMRIEPLDAGPFALGVGIGIAAWFALLVLLLGMFHRSMSDRTLGRVVKVMGWILVAGGAAFLVHLAVRR
jgi:cytochrome c biogenesis protein CcdA